MRSLDGAEAKTAGVEIAASPAPTSTLPGWATEAVPRVVRAAALDATAAG